METNDERQIRILKTLQALESVNNLINLHKNDGDEAELLLLKQYQRFKTQLTQELFELLAEYDIPTPLAA